VKVWPGVFDVDQRRRAADLTAAAGGWAWVVWGLWSRAYFAFGRWGAPIVRKDASAVRTAIGEAYGWPGWMKPGG
jgi:hypothetical protein